MLTFFLLGIKCLLVIIVTIDLAANAINYFENL